MVSLVSFVVVFFALISTIDISANPVPSSSAQECGKEGMCLIVTIIIVSLTITYLYTLQDWFVFQTLTVATSSYAQKMVDSSKVYALMRYEEQKRKELRNK